MTDYVLHIPDAMEGQLRGFNAGVRQAIQHKLNEIAQEATARAKDLPVVLGPPLRFYVYEGYRISYSVDPVSRRIVVQDLRRVPA